MLGTYVTSVDLFVVLLIISSSTSNKRRGPTVLKAEKLVQHVLLRNMHRLALAELLLTLP